MYTVKNHPLLILLLIFFSLNCELNQLWENPIAYLPTPTAGPISPLATSTPLPQGHNRNNPLWPHETAHALGWELTLESYLRGEEATEFVTAAFSSNKPPPEGMEYVAVHLSVKKTTADYHPYMQIRMTGSSRVIYDWFDTGAMRPDPTFQTDLTDLTESSGWLIYTIPKGMTQLMLYLNDFENDELDPQYLALEPGSLIEPWRPDTESTNILPYGDSKETAVPFRHQLITSEWKLELRDMIRGDDAWNRIYERNKYNEPAPEHLEYMMIYIVAQSLHTDDTLHYINEYDFAIQNHIGATYENPSIVDPYPEFDGTLYSGGSVSGWAVYLVPKSETELFLQFEPPFQYDETYFFSLLLTGR